MLKKKEAAEMRKSANGLSLKKKIRNVQVSMHRKGGRETGDQSVGAKGAGHPKLQPGLRFGKGMWRWNGAMGEKIKNRVPMGREGRRRGGADRGRLTEGETLQTSQ